MRSRMKTNLERIPSSSILLSACVLPLQVQVLLAQVLAQVGEQSALPHTVEDVLRLEHPLVPLGQSAPTALELDVEILRVVTFQEIFWLQHYSASLLHKLNNLVSRGEKGGELNIYTA